MAKSKKKKKNTRISAEEKAALRQERSELRAKQNRQSHTGSGGTDYLCCVADRHAGGRRQHRQKIQYG